jgi:hypothetical protein
MADNRSDQNNELVLNPIQFAYVLDTTKGIGNVLKGALANGKTEKALSSS